MKGVDIVFGIRSGNCEYSQFHSKKYDRPNPRIDIGNPIPKP